MTNRLPDPELMRRAKAWVVAAANAAHDQPGLVVPPLMLPEYQAFATYAASLSVPDGSQPTVAAPAPETVPGATSEAVERVARAIAAHKRRVSPDDPEIANKWQSYCGQARAALSALGQPDGGGRWEVNTIAQICKRCGVVMGPQSVWIGADGPYHPGCCRAAPTTQMGCVCPPTSEQTCQNPICPRKNYSLGTGGAS